ncbi:MAG: hypothetical protein EOO03_13505 [Chitinophagaceae bacterium]|nr:MAG: hypothetical protein EOO03_13505 [Chitinophagaceae bacterium]
MKTLSIILAFVLCATTGTVTAQQKFLATEEPGPPKKTYSGAHGPFYNGTVSDPTIPSRSAVPAGSLKGIKRNFTNKVIEGDTTRTNYKMMIGDDMQAGTTKKAATAKKKPVSKTTVW